MGRLAPLAMDGGLWIAWAAYWLLASRSVRKTEATEGVFPRLQHLALTIIGFILIFRSRGEALLLGPICTDESVKAAGVVLTASGLAFAVWARLRLGKYWSGIITLKEGHRLIRTGPYRLVRHPIYTGFLCASLGSAISSGTGDGFAGFAIMLAAYVVKIRREERVLSQSFGDEYITFKKEIPALLPWLY